MGYDSGTSVGKITIGLAVFGIALYFAITKGGTDAIILGAASGIGLLVAVVEILKIVDHKHQTRSRV